jgi:type VI secretion system protein ImpG
VVFRPLDGDPRPEPIIINRPEECLRPVGFEEEEGLLPYPRTSFVGYRLLTEFFAFANKFLFIDLGGWERVRRAGFQRRLEVIVFLDRTVPAVEQAVDSQTFGLGCTPVVNLFAQTAEPIPLSQTRFEYRIVPDVAHPLGLEVYSVDSVTCLDPVTKRTTDYQPFYSFRHGDFAETKRAYWYAVRKPALGESDRGTEVYLQLVDLDFNPRQPAEATLVVGTTCTNRDLPTLLRQVGEDIYLELEMAAPLAQLRCLRAPTPTLRPPLRRGAYWRLISHLSLNHLSLTEGPQGALALQELLRLYDFSAPGIGEQMSRVVGQLIDGIAGIASRRVVGRTGAETSSGFCRGVEVTIEFDEEKYVGNNLFLFASILERFLGTYVTVNSFSQLVARTRHKQETLKKWPPRAGDRVLL